MITLSWNVLAEFYFINAAYIYYDYVDDAK
jgi:hypothetical protein